MMAVLFAGVYGFFEKRVPNKRLATLYYFLSMGVIWTAIMLLMSVFVVGKDLVTGEADPAFFLLVIPIGFVLGEIFAFLAWLTGLRHSDKE